METRDMVKRNGNTETSNLPVRREENWSTPSVYNEMSQWMENWNRWFDNFFGRAFDLTPTRSLLPRWSNLGWGNQGTQGSQWGNFVPAININETDNEYRVTAELPGMTENDVELSLNRDSLVIRGEKKEEYEDQGKGYYRMERSYGTFHRTIPLPQEVDPEKVNANFKNGVLTVTLQKLPEEQSGIKRIPIKSESNR